MANLASTLEVFEFVRAFARYQFTRANTRTFDDTLFGPNQTTPLKFKLV
jgi:hypothetical protein